MCTQTWMHTLYPALLSCHHVTLCSCFSTGFLRSWMWESWVRRLCGISSLRIWSMPWKVSTNLVHWLGILEMRCFFLFVCLATICCSYSHVLIPQNMKNTGCVRAQTTWTCTSRSNGCIMNMWRIYHLSRELCPNTPREWALHHLNY